MPFNMVEETEVPTATEQGARKKLIADIRAEDGAGRWVALTQEELVARHFAPTKAGQPIRIRRNTPDKPGDIEDARFDDNTATVYVKVSAAS